MGVGVSVGVKVGCAVCVGVGEAVGVSVAVGVVVGVEVGGGGMGGGVSVGAGVPVGACVDAAADGGDGGVHCVGVANGLAPVGRGVCVVVSALVGVAVAGTVPASATPCVGRGVRVGLGALMDADCR